MADICQSLCEAVKIIIEGEQQKNPPAYDITKDCTVVGTKNKSKGRYDVSDGSSTFEAYATANNTYSLGDNVLVTIPQGDYKNQKTILNRILTDAVDAVGYVSPLDTFIKGSGNLIKSSKYGIIANGKEAMKKIWSLTKTDGLYFGFTRIALTADFMTLLQPGIIKGEYGLKLIIHGTKSKDQQNNPIAELTFSSSEMLGNVYSFNTFFNQEMVFTIPSNINTIEKMTLYLYQDGQFQDGNKNSLSPNQISDILVNNIEVYLGYQGDYATQEIVELACADLTFDNGSTNRDLALRWLHKIDEGVFEPINKSHFTNDETKNKYEIRWYHHVSGCADADTDEYGGKNWQRLPSPPKKPDNYPEGITWPPEDYPFVLPIKLDKNKTVEKFKVVTLIRENPLVNDPTYVETKNYTSNILEFENVEESTGGGAASADQQKEVLSLHFHDNSYGNYFIYDQNGILIDSANQGSSKIRQIGIFAYDEDISNADDLYPYIDWIKWEVPADTGNTMIQYSKSDSLEIKNTKENILKENYTLGKVIHYSNVGQFDYSFKTIDTLPTIKNEDGKDVVAFDTIKVYIYTTTKETETDWKKPESWDAINNRPYTYVFGGVKGGTKYSQAFTINREYKYLKIEHKYYKDDEEVSLNTSPVTDLVFKLFSNFHVGTATPTTDKDGKKEINTMFNYSILNNWNQNRNNNIIKCTISIGGVETVLTETLRFGIKGTSGTANTFILELLDGKNALEINNKPLDEFKTADGKATDEGKKTLRVEAMLINTNGKLVSLTDAASKGEIEFSLINGNENYMKLTTEKDSNNKDLPIVKIIAQTNILPEDNYAILQAKYNYPVEDASSGTTPDLYAFLPIPMKTMNCVSMSGPDKVLYNHMGAPRCGDGAYIAFGANGKERYNWKLKQKDNNPNPLSLTAASTTPQNQADKDKDQTAKENVKGSVTLLPSPLYTSLSSSEDNIQDAACVYCYTQKSDGSYGAAWWSQPILIMQSQYDFAMLNAWDGSLTIDEENGTILATMLGAGKKNDNNTFSGVLIGDVKGGTGLNDTVTMTGVYGFDEGIMSYGLMENGTAFFGNKAKGRIEIDGEHGIIKSAGWIYKDNKWKLKSASDTEKDYSHIPANMTTGTLIDLDDGQLQMFGGEDNYLKFNADETEKGKLEMALSGLNIKLTDKSDKSLSGYIDVTAKGLTSEFRKTAVYAVTCSTSDKIADKVLNLDDFSNYAFTNSSNKNEDSIGKLTLEDLYYDGLTIAVTFVNAEPVTRKNIDIKQTIDGVEKVIGFKEQRKGRALRFKINDNYKNIYINEKATNNTPSCNDQGIDNPGSNSFGWSSGSTIYFTYKGNYNSGYWAVSDSGSYSRITQTADMIQSEVANVAGTLGSTITQTANSIRSEVRQKANYNCRCETNATTAEKVIRFNDSDYAKIPSNIQRGFTISVYFVQANNVTSDLKFKLCNSEATQYKSIFNVANSPKWEAGETLPFVYNGSEFVMTSLSNSTITQTAHSITSEVRRTAGYGCTMTKSNTGTNYQEWKFSDIKIDDKTINDIFYSGVTLAATFTSAQNKEENTTHQIWITDKNGNNDKPLYYKGAVATSTGKDALTWAANDTLFLCYDENKTTNFNGTKYKGAWVVVDSGSYSKIQQTADEINASVEDIIGNKGTLTIKVDTIENKVETAEGNISTLTTNTAGISATSISRSGTSFAMRLDTNGFYLNNSSTANSSNYKFKCDKDGIYINGGGTFSGELSAATGTFSGELTANSTSFKTLKTGTFTLGESTAQTNIQGTYSTEISSNTFKIRGISSDSTKAAEIVFMAQDSSGLNDATMYARCLRGTDRYDGYGNLGNSTHKWDTLYTRTTNSTRTSKQSIEVYNTQQAYEELKSLPLYSYKYTGSQESSKTLFLGTMIDYLPNEVMRISPTNDGTFFEHINLTYWNIAASQVTQSKLEDLILRVEALEQKEEKYNGIN